MKLNFNLIEGEVVKRYNSLLLDVKLFDGKIVSAFCPAEEVCSMSQAGTKVLLRAKGKKYSIVRYEVEFLVMPEGLLLANSLYNRTLFREAVKKGIISEFSDLKECREILKGDELEHVDYELVLSNGEHVYVFIENLFNKVEGYSMFPQGINFFEMKVFDELSQLRSKGHRTAVFMLIPREDCHQAKFSWKLDPVAAAKIYDEAKKGLEFICYGCKVTKNDVTISKQMNIIY